MHALQYSRFGGRDVLELTDIPEPHIGPDSVVVEVHAAALNPVDYKIREGYLEGLIDVDLPAVPGWDVSGVVVAAGLDTPELQVGDEVFGYVRKDVVRGGTLAERVSAPVRTLARKPRSIDHVHAAAIPLTGLTALQSVRRAQVGPGDTVIVHGAAGGVGTFGVQLARLTGARVIGTASDRHHEFLARLRVEPVAYGEGLADRVRDLAPEGVDVILDFAGGASLDVTGAIGAPGVRVVSIADPRARTEQGGTYLWVRPDATDLETLARHVDAGELHVEVAATFPLERAVEGYALLEDGHVRGKVVIEVAQGR